nr:carbohydrate kinase family protein [Candidatus Sigynarchaeota archaeon]
MVLKVMIVGEMHNDLFYKCDAFSKLEHLVVERLLSSSSTFSGICDTTSLETLIHEAIADMPKKIAVEAFIKRGGNGNNSTELFGKLGIPVKLMTVIGKNSSWMAKELQDMGVDTSCVFEVDAITPVSTIIEDPATTKIFVAPNLKKFMNFESVTFSPNMFDDASIVFFTPLAPKFKPVLDAMLSENLHVLTAVTIESQALGDLASVEAILEKKVDILFIGKGDSAFITKSINVADVDAKLSKHARIRIITLGKEGCVIHSDYTREVYIPIVPVAVIDRTGAGDAFAAGVLLRCHQLIEKHGPFIAHVESLDAQQRVDLFKNIGTFGSFVAA